MEEGLGVVVAEPLLSEVADGQGRELDERLSLGLDDTLAEGQLEGTKEVEGWGDAEAEGELEPVELPPASVKEGAAVKVKGVAVEVPLLSPTRLSVGTTVGVTPEEPLFEGRGDGEGRGGREREVEGVPVAVPSAADGEPLELSPADPLPALDWEGGGESEGEPLAKALPLPLPELEGEGGSGVRLGSLDTVPPPPLWVIEGHPGVSEGALEGAGLADTVPVY